jgi:membrane-associated phospholipid phosphatase
MDNVMPETNQQHGSRHLTRSAAVIKANLSLPLERRRRGVRTGKASTGAVTVAFLWFFSAAFISALFAVLLDEQTILARPEWPPFINAASRILTRFGKSDWILIPTALIAIALTFLHLQTLGTVARFQLYRLNVWLSFVFIGVGLPSLLATLLKRIIGRPRPRYFEEHGLYGFTHFSTDAGFASFPSGHSTTIGALAMVVSLVAPRLTPVAVIAALAVGASRVGVGAHHPSDVVAGLAFGALGAFLVARWYAGSGLMFTARSGLMPVVRPAMQFSRLRASRELVGEIAFQSRQLLKGAPWRR